MPRLKLHVKSQILLGLLISLGSCGKQAAGESARVDFTDVSASNALTRVDALERRIAELERQLERNKKATDAALSRAAADRRAESRDIEALHAFRRRTLERLEAVEARSGT